MVVLSHHLYIRCSDFMKNNKYQLEPIKTVLTIVTGALFIYILAKVDWVLYFAISVGVFGLLFADLSNKINFLWMKLTWVLSKIMPAVLLSFIFFLILTPIALLSRILGTKNPLLLKNKERTLFKNCNKSFDKASFEKPW